MSYSEGWITVPGKGKRWRDSSGKFYLQRPAGSQSFFNALGGAYRALDRRAGGILPGGGTGNAASSAVATGVRRAAGVVQSAGRAWSEADRRLGGWLPGGGVASPATRAVTPPQPHPRRSEELERATGIRSRIVDPDKTPTLVSRIAPQVYPRWGSNDYANPVLGEVGMRGYQGGATPQERYTEFHELGHLNPKDKKIYSRLGVLGRAMQGISDSTGNLPPVDLAAGVALQAFDAREEDRAERFAKAHAGMGNYQGPEIYADGTSDYGNSLRREGRQLRQDSVQRMKDPFGAVSGVRQVANRLQVGPAQAELRRVESELIPMVRQENYEVTPELVEMSRRHSELSNRLRKLGVEPEIGSGFR